MVRSPVLALLFLTACTQAVVVKEGSGWREVQSSGSATTVEVTTTDPRELAEIARTLPEGEKHAWAWVTRTYLFDQIIRKEIAEGADLVTWVGDRDRVVATRRHSRPGDQADKRGSACEHPGQ